MLAYIKSFLTRWVIWGLVREGVGGGKVTFTSKEFVILGSNKSKDAIF